MCVCVCEVKRVPIKIKRVFQILIYLGGNNILCRYLMYIISNVTSLITIVFADEKVSLIVTTPWL